MLHTVCLINYGAQQLAGFARQILLGPKIQTTSGSFSDELSESTSCSREKSLVDGSLSRKLLLAAGVWDSGSLFRNLFTEDGSFDIRHVQENLEGIPLQDVLSEQHADLDHYNLLEKAILYNDSRLVDVVLAYTEQPADDNPGTADRALRCFVGAIHLAAFLGCEDIVEILLDHDPRMVFLRGNVRIRPVAGPPSDLFSIIGYSSHSRCPRLSFQAQWLETHPNERPVHFAICAGHTDVMELLLRTEEACSLDYVSDNIVSSSNLASVSERDIYLDDLIRQAASCASSSCLNSLYAMIPDGRHRRNNRGWLLTSGGFSHGAQFLRFLLEQSFSVKLLNNVDGHNTVTALHVFYNSLGKDDGIVAKYSELYDVTELMVDIGIDINRETTAFRSHGHVDTALHLLIPHVNLVIPPLRKSKGFNHDRDLVEEQQRFFDQSLKDTVLLLTENGYDVRPHQVNLLKLLFSNTNYARRYEMRARWPCLVEGGCGLKNMLTVAKILMEGGVYLDPKRREQTACLGLIAGLRKHSALMCVANDTKNSLQFQMCLQQLLANGDNPNSYPLSANEDSYLAPPIIQLIDIYFDRLCTHSGAEELLDFSADSVLHVAEVLASFGADFRCQMSLDSAYFRHAILDGCWPLLNVIQKDLLYEDQKANFKRLKLAKKIVLHCIQLGAEPELEEYIFIKSGHPPPAVKEHFSLLYRYLCLGLYGCQNLHHPGSAVLLSNPYFLSSLEALFNMAASRVYYTCAECAAGIIDRLDINADDGRTREFIRCILRRRGGVRSLKQLCRYRVYSAWRVGYRGIVQQLLYPTVLKDYLVEFERQ